MFVHVRTQVLGIDRKLRRLAGQRFIARGADPASQRRLRSGDRARQLIASIVDLGGLLPRRQRIGGQRTPRRELRTDGVGEQLVLALQVIKQRAATLDEIAIEPGERSVALDFEQAHASLSLRAGRAGPRDIGLGPPPRAVGHVLHQAHLAHRHDIARQAPLIGAADRQVVDGDDEFRIRQSPRRTNRGFGGSDTCRLQRDIGRLAARQLERGIETQGLRPRNARSHQQ